MDLLHLRARYYAPEIGTFLSRDPVESEPPYQYVRGNPATLVDPSGANPLCIPLVIIDGPLPIGDAVCVILIGGTLWAGYVAATGPTAPPSVDIPSPGPYRPTYPPGYPVPVPAPENPVGTGENPLTLPAAYQAPRSDVTPEPKPNPRPTRTFDPGPPVPPTCTPEPEKHISLGTAEETEDGELIANLAAFTMQLNDRLNPMAYVYDFTDWQSAGLATSSFPASFDEAAHNPRTKKIHFNLFGVQGDPNQFIQQRGGNGVFFARGSSVTAVELYKVKNEGLCGKTKFYRRVTPATGDSIGEWMARGTFVESMDDWVSICSGP